MCKPELNTTYSCFYTYILFSLLILILISSFLKANANTSGDGECIGSYFLSPCRSEVKVISPSYLNVSSHFILKFCIYISISISISISIYPYLSIYLYNLFVRDNSFEGVTFIMCHFSWAEISD